MILNLLRVETLKVEEMIKRSFSENTSQSLLPENLSKILRVSSSRLRLCGYSSGMKNEKRLESTEKLTCEHCSRDIESFYDASREAVELTNQLIVLAAAHPQGSKFFSPGRVVVLRDGVRSSY